VPPLVLDVTNAFRANLLRADEAAMRQMAARWLDIERQLAAQIDALSLELSAMEGPITMGQLQRMRRYKTRRLTNCGAMRPTSRATSGAASSMPDCRRQSTRR
jgi:hypothetical protein